MNDLMLEWIEESFPKESDVDRSGRVGPSSSRESFGIAGMMQAARFARNATKASLWPVVIVVTNNVTRA